jgi:proteasome assembly chaperone (PAC2) family protein
MNIKEWVVPGATVIFAAGVSFTSFESAAQEVEEIDQRVEVLESKSGKQEIVDIKIEGVEKRLDKMEDIVAKMLEMQQQQAINQAAICQATGASCSR